MKSKELGALGKGLRALWERNKFVLLVIAAGAALLLLPALPGGGGAAGESAAAAGEEADAFQAPGRSWPRTPRARWRPTPPTPP